MDSSVFGNVSLPSEQPPQDNTTTFLVGFGVLLIFVIVGLMASAFLCITLKKDQYLWASGGAETQMQDKRRSLEEAVHKNEPDGKNEVIPI